VLGNGRHSRRQVRITEDPGQSTLRNIGFFFQYAIGSGLCSSTQLARVEPFGAPLESGNDLASY
jgi:hypothetical protein